MDRTTTLIAAVGKRFDRPCQRVAQVSGNVALEPAPDPVESLTDWVDELRNAWLTAQRRSAIYTLMTGDPLAAVVREWARRLDGTEHDLELAIGLSTDAPLPDFYFIDPAIEGSSAHWYLDHVTRLAPRRVVLVEPTEQAVLGAVRHLPYGPSLPSTREVVESARTYVPIPGLEPEGPPPS